MRSISATEAGHHDDAEMVESRIFAQHATEAESAQLRQHQFGDEEIGLLALREGERRGSGRRPAQSRETDSQALPPCASAIRDRRLQRECVWVQPCVTHPSATSRHAGEGTSQPAWRIGDALARPRSVERNVTAPAGAQRDAVGVDRRTAPKQPGRVRPGVWILTAACLLAAAGLAGALARREAAQSSLPVAAATDGASADIRSVDPPAEVARTPVAAAASAAAAGIAAGAHAEGPGTAPDATQPLRRELRPGPPGAIAMARADAPGDSHVAAEIRVLEAEAARVAESLELVPEEPRAAPADRAAEDARLQRLADALLVEHFVQDAYRGTLFPTRVPRRAAHPRGGGEPGARLTPEMRRDLLDVVLQSDELATRVGPEFAPPEAGLVWENASR